MSVARTVADVLTDHVALYALVAGTAQGNAELRRGRGVTFGPGGGARAAAHGTAAPAPAPVAGEHAATGGGPAADVLLRRVSRCLDPE